MNRGSRVQATRYKEDAHAVCDVCRGAKQWTRERVRQHVIQTGHTVRYVIEDVTVYRPLSGAS